MVPVITIRIEDEIKGKLEEAAKSRDMSLTSFVLEAALKAADKALRAEKIWHSLGVPGTRKPSPHFMKLCEEAGQGGENSWRTVGFKMACSTEDEQLYGPISKERLMVLKKAFEEADQDAIFNWYGDEFPKHIFLVPTKRRYRFVEGLQGAFRDGYFKF